MTALQDSRSYILDRRRPTSLMDVHILSTLSVFLSLVLMVDKLQGWQVDTRANVELKVEDTVLEVQRFGGNETSPDHFKVILSDGDSLLVGARNYVYNISLITLRENKRIKWFSSSRFIQLCTRKQKSSEQCQNYIRVIAKKSDNKILVCGTNAYKPWCRTYQDVENQYVHLTDDSGIAKCPYDPSHNNTAVYVDDQLFSGTYSDINARDALIYKRPMRTEQHDSQWLNEPNFVSSFDYKDKVYFFFRETAVEYINCGKAVFSRVARVCKNDRGGRLLLQNTWTSFFKARLNCSIPGEFPFYFDEIQSTTEMGQGNYMPTATWNNRTDVVYAVFNTPQNSITGSAVCVYRLQDIARVFGGTFKEQETARSNWLPVNAMQIPKPHPAKQCGNSSFKDQGPMLNFIKSHTLMDEAVPAFGGRPVLVHTSFNFRLTQIVVDWQVKAADARYYDVMFLGTDDGRVIKAVNKGQEGKVETVIIEDIQVFDNRTPVVKVKLFRNQKKSQEKLVVISRDEIKAIPLHRCHLRTTCV